MLPKCIENGGIEMCVNHKWVEDFLCVAEFTSDLPIYFHMWHAQEIVVFAGHPRGPHLPKELRGQMGFQLAVASWRGTGQLWPVHIEWSGGHCGLPACRHDTSVPHPREPESREFTTLPITSSSCHLELCRESILLICWLDFRGPGWHLANEKFWSQQVLWWDAWLCPC
jgi:hypothetical protein